MLKMSVNYTLSEEYVSELPLLLYPMYILTPQLIVSKKTNYGAIRQNNLLKKEI